MRLVEFLTHNTTPKQLVGFLKGKLGIDVAHYVLDETDSVIEMDPSIFDKIDYTVKGFDELLDAYGWRIGAYSDWSLVLRNSRTEYKSDSKFAKQFHGLYLRAAHRNIEVFSKIGFRPHKENSWTNEEPNATKVGPIYNEGRVYLWSIEEIAAHVKNEYEFWNNVCYTIKAMQAYGKNTYLVRLPDSVKVYKDPEYTELEEEVSTGACFTTQKLDPSWIELVSSGGTYRDTVQNLKKMIGE